MSRVGLPAIAAIAGLVWLATPAAAQTAAAASKPDRTIDINWGYTVFTDEDQRFEHTLLGGAARLPVTARLAIGPEVAHLRGPVNDRDWIVGGKITFDLVPDTGATPRAVVPYVVGGGGWLHHSDIVNEEPETVNTGIANGGAGARISLGRYLYVAPEFRLGAETHWQFGLTIGIRDRRQGR